MTAPVIISKPATNKSMPITRLAAYQIRSSEADFIAVSLFITLSR